MAQRHITKNQEESLDRENLESFKAFLGPIASQYSDPQLVQLRSDMHAAARLLLDLYLLKKQYSDEAASRGFDNLEAKT
jgi:hypothetical protein